MQCTPSLQCITSRGTASVVSLQVGTTWVTAPPGRPRGVIHFEPGAFVGAAPQLTYQLLIQLLAGAGYTVSALCCTWGCLFVCSRHCVCASGHCPDGCPACCLL